jgi:Asp/Glu/hydantoin racemase
MKGALKMKRLILIHTVSPLIEVFNRLCSKIIPGVQVLHILDEPLLRMIREQTGAENDYILRLQNHVAFAKKANPGAILVTCSTVSPLVDKVQKKSKIPVLKIDDAMIAEAVNGGPSIGVVATLTSTLEPTRSALEHRANKEGKKIGVKMVHVEYALGNLLKGKADLHDEQVRDAVYKLLKQTDVIVLAQASMARVLETIPESERLVPILSSPHLALEQIKQFF